MSIGRTIRIYLDDGSVAGIRHAEIVNWTGQAISSSRKQIKSLSLWPESQKPGVYFLFGIDDDSGNPAVYIGEGENVYSRVQKHLSSKDFWNEVVFFTNKDDNLTKGHIKFLESRLVLIAKEAQRYVVLNANTPQEPMLPRGDKDSMEEFISNLKTLLGVIGHRVLEKLTVTESSSTEIIQTSKQESLISTDKLYLSVSNLEAWALISDEGIVVLEGSQVSRKITDSLSMGNRKLRDKLIDNEVIIERNENLEFQKNQLFTSPSQAAAIIVGYSINGRHTWKTVGGTTLKELEEVFN